MTPVREWVEEVSALPYDVYNREEARAEVEQHPHSFLSIDRPETQFPVGQDMYADCVYAKADEMLQNWEKEHIFEMDSENCYYIWELTMDGRAQTGLVACSSVDDYLQNVVKKHENTRADKEKDRCRHVDTTSAQTGPIFLAYRANAEIHEILAGVKRQEPLVSYTAVDGVGHRVWRIADEKLLEQITEAFGRLFHTYIADGHHRAASAVSVSRMRREKYPEYTGEEEFNYFLSVLFPDDELEIMDYNRVLKDLNGYSEAEILERIGASCTVEKAVESPYRPKKKGEFGLLLNGSWYKLTAKAEHAVEDPVEGLDVSFLQREVLQPIWNIQDPRTDARIDFVGGIRGLGELERRCEADCKAAFSLYPTSIEELFAVADADLLMPPKSTWFEPKLRSGLFIHKIER